MGGKSPGMEKGWVLCRRQHMSDTELKTSDILALDRTRMAAERTLMAWFRTALSMISFGFTIYKFLQVLQEQSTVPSLRPDAPRNLGLALIGIGTFALITACVQHWTYIRKLSPAHPYRPWDLTFIVSWLIALLGLLIFGSIILRSGPLG
jgi:putative membrane protein